MTAPAGLETVEKLCERHERQKMDYADRFPNLTSADWVVFNAGQELELIALARGWQARAESPPEPAEQVAKLRKIVDDGLSTPGKTTERTALDALCKLAHRARWIKSSERLPEEWQEVLIYHVLGDQARSPRAYDVAWYHAAHWTFPWGAREITEPTWVTHWMHLPEQPK